MEMKWRNIKIRQIIANLPSEACSIFHAGFGVATGRSSDLQALPVKIYRHFYLPIFPVSEKTSDN
jgi:hypothetical protein